MMPEPLTGRDIWLWREAVSADKSLTAAARLTALRLSFHADPKGGPIWVPQEKLATELGMHRRSVQVHLASVLRRDWLAYARSPIRGQVTRYHLTMASKVDAYTRQGSKFEVDANTSHDMTQIRVMSGRKYASQVVHVVQRSELRTEDATAFADAQAAAPSIEPPTKDSGVTVIEKPDGSMIIRMPGCIPERPE